MGVAPCCMFIFQNCLCHNMGQRGLVVNKSLIQSSIETIHERRNGITSLLVWGLPLITYAPRGRWGGQDSYLHLYCIYIRHDSSLGICFTKKCRIALKGKGLSCPIGIENGEIIKVYVKISKSKNGLFGIWYIYIGSCKF